MCIRDSLLELPRTTPEEYLNGEMGSNTQRGRDRESKLVLLNHILTKTVKLKRLVEVNRGREVTWIEKCERYLKEVSLSWEELEMMEAGEVKSWNREVCEKEWRIGMEEKSSLKFYRGWKKRLKKGRERRSERRDRVVKRFQSGVWLRIWNGGERRTCSTCGVKEDEEHILRFCERTASLRRTFGVERETSMEDILFGGFDDYLVEVEGIWRVWEAPRNS